MTQSTTNSIYSDITTIFRVLFRNLWIIILVVIVGTAGVYFLLNTQEAVYEATTTVIIAPQIEEGDDAEALRVIDTMRYNIVGTYVQLLRSRTNRLESETDLSDTYEQQALRDAIVEVRAIENSSVISVIVRANQPELSRDLANDIAEQAINTEAIPSITNLYPMIVLDSAQLPEEPVSPDMRLGLILGFAGSFIVGLILVFIVDTIRQFRNQSNDDS